MEHCHSNNQQTYNWMSELKCIYLCQKYNRIVKAIQTYNTEISFILLAIIFYRGTFTP